jgi:PAS domain-containing protein
MRMILIFYTKVSLQIDPHPKIIENLELFTLKLFQPALPEMMSLVLDITERKQTEETLRESEEKFQLMANSISQLT